MKKLILMLLLLSVLVSEAQTTANSSAGLISDIQKLLDKNNKAYNPKLAFSICAKVALQGDAEAMSVLGTFYNDGIGTNIDKAVAFNWFTQAANKGSVKAWYNLGLMYKNGSGTDQDYEKAYSCFSKGTALNRPMCFYEQGYMLYKGLGCTQSYKKAFPLFQKAAAQNIDGGMYFLGLCYRNGYGVKANTDSAKYWLSKAANKKYNRAIQELATSRAENIDMVGVINLQPATPGETEKNVINDYPKVKHNLPAEDISGDYVGYAVKFDWSGKHIIGKSALKLTLKHEENTLRGKWVEDDSLSTSVSAQINSDGIVFNKTGYKLHDHYNTKSPNNLEFKNAQLQLMKNGDTVFINGNLQLYSDKHKEPEKPMYIMLTRVSKSSGNENNFSSKADSVHFIVFPNPFTSNLQVRYTLKHPALVSLLVSNLLNAGIIYKSAAQLMSAGEHTSTFVINGQPGTYVVTLNYGKQVKSVIVLKR